MATTRLPVYQRLPEIYRIRDEEQRPPGQLKAYLDILDVVGEAVRADIETLYHDLFIETCADWVIPYLADLLGTSHLSGDPWTLRADVARTIFHRRRKGTLGAIESLTYTLSGWAAHTVEFRERLLWNQHLNHQRPDLGGQAPTPALIGAAGHISGAVRGGTLTLRDPALLSFLGGTFDPFARVVDVKPITLGVQRPNLPNLGIFLWRLEDHTVPVTRPVLAKPIHAPATGTAAFALCYELHALGEPMVLFNTYRFHADDDPPELTHPDAVPGPMPRARLSAATPAGNPDAYVAIDLYDGVVPVAPGEGHVGLTLHMPQPVFGTTTWTLRGENLCAWEDGLIRSLASHEIVIDPELGRLLIGVGGAAQSDEADPLAAGLHCSATYGFSGSTLGSIGAHPAARDGAPAGAWRINYRTAHDGTPAPDGSALRLALADLADLASPRVIEIQDSALYDLDLDAVAGIDEELGLETLRLGASLTLRAAPGQRPIIRLQRPLTFRADDPATASTVDVTLEGLYLTWDKTSAQFGADTALIERAAVNRLRILGCTLDPGSHAALDGTRQQVRYGLRLANDYGFEDSGEYDAFEQDPQIEVARSICGPMAIDSDYGLTLRASILDAASGLEDDDPALALHALGDPLQAWGPALSVDGLTCFGGMRVSSATGAGGIWVHRLEVHDTLKGCIRQSRFCGVGDRLPQHLGCVSGSEALLGFSSETFGEAGYAQLHPHCDRRILEQGPNRDEMGAFGLLLNTHKWKNINIRYREHMPVGVRPVLIPIT